MVRNKDHIHVENRPPIVLPKFAVQIDGRGAREIYYNDATGS